MLDEVARNSIEMAMLPSSVSGEGARNLVSEAFLEWLASTVFESDLQGHSGWTAEDVARLSLASSILQDSSDPDPATSFVVAETADVARISYARQTESETGNKAFRRAVHYLDSALFFHLSDYDANADVLARRASRLLDSVDFVRQQVATEAQVAYYRAVADFFRGDLGSCIERSTADIPTDSTEDRTYAFLRNYLGQIARGYRGEEAQASEEHEKLLELSGMLQAERHPYSVLRSEVDKLLQISTLIGSKSLYRVLASSFEVHEEYLMTRLAGQTEGSYVFAWPPTREFCSQYIDKNVRHAVITTPTGTGKSFLAELAVAQALEEGWALYIAPTNALCAQITDDLRQSLSSMTDVEVKGFPGKLDYSPELPRFEVARNVLVITPEKALLLLKREPEVFREFRLLVLDEFHILVDPNRGDIVETVLSFAVASNPDLRVIMMSALVENSEHLARWLEARTGGAVATIPLQGQPWRPTRIARLTVFPDSRTLTPVEGEAREIIRVRAFSDAVTPWEEDTPLYSWLTPIHIEREMGKSFPWRNEVSRRLAKTFVDRGIKTMVFVLKSRHHAFSIASDFKADVPETTRCVTQREQDLFELAEYELGAPSLLEKLVREHGAAVHTSAMLDCEREAAQMAFSKEGVDLLVATGTLSQGLNLMARAVIVCGTQLSEYADYDMTRAEFRQQSLNQVLNALGRAARASITCRGVGVIVPDRFEWSLDETAPKRRFFQRIEALRLKDAALTVDSPIRDLLSEVQIDSLNKSANRAECLLLARLPSDSEFLRLTLETSLGAVEIEGEAQIQQVVQRLEAIRSSAVEAGCDEWLLTASSWAGIDFRVAEHLRGYVERLTSQEGFTPPSDTYVGWTRFLAAWLRALPAVETWEILRLHLRAWQYWWPPDRDPNVRRRLEQLNYPDHVTEEALEQLDPIWDNMETTLVAWLQDRTYLEIAETLTRRSCKPESRVKRTSPGNFLPRALGWSQQFIDRMSRFAGLLLAVRDQWLENEPDSIPDWLAEASTLSTLPQGLRFGVSNAGALAWNRYITNERLAANLLQRLCPVDVETADDLASAYGSVREAFEAFQADESYDDLGLVVPALRRLYE